MRRVVDTMCDGVVSCVVCMIIGCSCSFPRACASPLSKSLLHKYAMKHAERRMMKLVRKYKTNGMLSEIGSCELMFRDASCNK